jgi:tripartite-type tricarboxylate transporter receptor subunit TctC
MKTRRPSAAIARDGSPRITRLAARLVASTMLLAASGAAMAQGWPNRPVKLVVPFGPGAPDSVARIVAQPLGTQTGQTFVIDNRAGANGIIGAELVARAAPDGYTLLLTSVSFSVNPGMEKRLPFDPLRDFVAVSNVADQEAMFVIVNPALPIHSVRDLVAWSRQAEGRLSFASIGIGNTTHLAAELFNLRAGIKATHVPYKGGAQAVAAVMAGEVQMMVVPPTQSIEQIRAGRVRPLAYTYRTRSALMPEVPTTAESGVTGAEFDGGWFGLFAPALTPPAIIERLHAELRTALANPQTQSRLSALGLRGIGSGPDEFKRQVESEMRQFAQIIQSAGIKSE